VVLPSRRKPPVVLITVARNPALVSLSSTSRESSLLTIVMRSFIVFHPPGAVGYRMPGTWDWRLGTGNPDPPVPDPQSPIFHLQSSIGATRRLIAACTASTGPRASTTHQRSSSAAASAR